MTQTYADLHTYQIIEINWQSIRPSDVVFMQRPFTPSHVKIAEIAKDNNKPLWVDYDDDLFGVPLSNRTHKIYNATETNNAIISIMEMADLISVSTEHLGNTLRAILRTVSEKTKKPYVEKIVVLSNAYDEELYSNYASEMPKEQRTLVSWRGSDTHDKDLLYFTDALTSVVSRNLNWTYNFIGSPFWYTIERLDLVPGIKEKSVIVTDSMDPNHYMKFLHITAPSVMMVPLWDCHFNRSKSNIAWIEGCHAGACSIAPDWPEWRKPGILNYKNPKDFADLLELCIRGEVNTKKLAIEGRDYIRENLTLRKVNLKRVEILRTLLEKGKLSETQRDQNSDTQLRSGAQLRVLAADSERSSTIAP